MFSLSLLRIKKKGITTRKVNTSGNWGLPLALYTIVTKMTPNVSAFREHCFLLRCCLLSVVGWWGVLFQFFHSWASLASPSPPGVYNDQNRTKRKTVAHWSLKLLSLTGHVSPTFMGLGRARHGKVPECRKTRKHNFPMFPWRRSRNLFVYVNSIWDLVPRATPAHIFTPVVATLKQYL